VIRRKNGSSIDGRGNARSRFKSAILAQLAAVTIAAAAIPLAGAGAAQAAAAPAARDAVSLRSASVAPLAQFPRAAGQAAAAPCPIPAQTFDRTRLCFREKMVLVILQNKVPVGGGVFTVTHYLHVNPKGTPKGTDYSEVVRISGVVLTGEAKGAVISLLDRCGRTCSAVGNNFPSGSVLRSGLQGTLTFQDFLARGDETGVANSYTWIAEAAGLTAVASYQTPLFYRCDNVITSWPQGCVFAQATPVMTSMLQLPHIAANIRRIQNRGEHVGKIGSRRPLHRITSTAQANRNRNISCPRNLPRPKGESCDEYPFASTREGGNGVPANSRGRAMVPTGEQNKQRDLIRNFYNAERLLNEDAFWVFV
jgi:Deoxyribonuclease NucA/NucB